MWHAAVVSANGGAEGLGGGGRGTVRDVFLEVAAAVG